MTWKSALLFSAVVLIVGAIGAALVVSIWFVPQRGAMLLEVLKIIVSWPFVVALLAFAFGMAYRTELGLFIKNIGKIRLPGGAEILTQDLPDEQAAKKFPDPEHPPLTPELADALRQGFEELAQRAANADQQREAVIDEAVKVITQKDQAIYYWFFRYLNVFLVERTKLVLAWLEEQELHPTPRAYHLAWTPVIEDEEQRETILTVLLNFGLVAEEGGMLRLQPNGQQFLRFLRGQWPPQ